MFLENFIGMFLPFIKTSCSINSEDMLKQSEKEKKTIKGGPIEF